MKRIVSLLLSVMMLMSMVTFTAVASTDAVYENAEILENELSTGALVSSRPSNISYFASGFNDKFSDSDVNVIADEEDASNKIFEISGYTATSNKNILKYLNAGSTGSWKNAQMLRFSAKVKLPSVDNGTVELFVPSNGYDANHNSIFTFGVYLKNGGAYYYDETDKVLEPFIADGTMNADEWYRVEAIMDNRQAKTGEGRRYMNAFVYNDSNILVGTSGWQYVDSGISTYSGDQLYAYLASHIHAGGYEDGECVYVDEFNVYRINNLPTYTFDAEYITDAQVKYNKYITTAANANYRTLGERFANSSNRSPISDGSDITALRIEMDFRIPTITEGKVYNFLDYKGNQNAATSPFNGTVVVTGSQLVVNSYNTTTSTYDTAVNLSNDSTTYTIEANKWYKLVWDIDFSTFASPVAKLCVKNEAGSTLVETKATYAARPWSNTNNTSLILYGAPAKKADSLYHVDNTAVYVASAVNDLSNENARTCRIKDDFEKESYTIGQLYNDLLTTANGHIAKINSYSDTVACVAMDEITEDNSIEFTDGMTLPDTAPVKFTFNYTQPVPASNINKNNIELFADDVKKSTGYTVTAGTTDANNCASDFVVEISDLAWDTDYILRLKGELADYNTALSGGVPADCGICKDITFSVGEMTGGYDITTALVDTNGTAIAKSALSEDDTIKGSVTITNNTDSPLTCYAIIALYDGTNLSDVAMTDTAITVGAGQTIPATTPVLTAAKDGLTAKLFIWNDLELMKPLIIPATLPANQ